MNSIQEEEIESLTAIFYKNGEFTTVKGTHGIHVTVDLDLNFVANCQEMRNNICTIPNSINFYLVPDYPHAHLPEIMIRCSYLPVDVLKSIKHQVEERAATLLGQPMLLDLHCLAQELLVKEIEIFQAEMLKTDCIGQQEDGADRVETYLQEQADSENSLKTSDRLDSGNSFKTSDRMGIDNSFKTSNRLGSDNSFKTSDILGSDRSFKTSDRLGSDNSFKMSDRLGSDNSFKTSNRLGSDNSFKTSNRLDSDRSFKMDDTFSNENSLNFDKPDRFSRENSSQTADRLSDCSLEMKTSEMHKVKDNCIRTKSLEFQGKSFNILHKEMTHDSSVQNLSKCDSNSQTVTALLHLDHMRSKHNYIKLIKKWTVELGLTGRLIFSKKLILILLQGSSKSVKEYIVRNRSNIVDIDSKGRACKERMLTILCEVRGESHIRLSEFQVLELPTAESILTFLQTLSMEELYFNYVSPLVGWSIY